MSQSERISHRTANQNRVGLFKQTVDDFDFVRNLCAAENDNKRARRIFQFISQKLQLALHEQPRGALTAAFGHHASDPFSGSMGAMRCAEGVIDINVGNLGEFFCKCRIIGFFFFVITDIFEQKHIAVFHGGNGFFDFLADTIIHKSDGLAE